MDYVILTNTIQVLHRPLFLIQEVARVGKKCIISFPNFAHWSVRAQLFFRGKMPKSPRLPYEWYDSPNIHLTTIKDFREFCQQLHLIVLQEVALRTTAKGDYRRVTFAPNFFADTALFLVEQNSLKSSGIK
jgi:homoserine O-acetyltransferase